MYKTNFKRLGLSKYRTKPTANTNTTAITATDEVLQSDHTRTWNTIFECISKMVVVPRVGHAAVGRPMRSLSSAGVDGCAEALLWHVTAYSEAWLEARSSSPSLFTQTSKTWDMLKRVGPVSFAFFDIGQGAAALEHACDIVNKLMNQGSNNLLPIVLVEFCGKWWSHFRDLRHSLLLYLTKMAAIRLGAQHPLTVVLFHLMNEDVATFCMDIALQLVMQIVERDQPLVDESVLSIRHAYCCMLLDYEQYQAALAPVQWLLDEALKLYGQSGVLTRCSLLREAEIHIGFGAIYHAKLSCEKALQLSEGAHLCETLDAVGIEAATRLANLHLATGDPALARGLCERAMRDLCTLFSQVAMRSMGLALKVMLEEMLVDANTLLEVQGQQSICLQQPGEHHSGDHNCQVPLTDIAALVDLDDCVAMEAASNESKTSCPDPASKTELGIVLPVRNLEEDPIAMQYYDVVRRSAQARCAGWRDRPCDPPG